MINSKIHDFQYDKFQLDAIESVNNGHSLIVSAPTGAGKTAIAEYVCHDSISKGKGIIYTAPIKALSNQKYRDFTTRYGKDKVGIVTGDVSLNPYAQILIMTTEIFRNRLLEGESFYEYKEWVIFDEIHYLDDVSRGTVWEESLIFFPKVLKILALSATIPNIFQLRDWIKSIHKIPIDIIIEDKRPVPLSFYFMAENKFYTYNKNLKQLLQSKNHKAPPNRIDTLINHLKDQQLFPTIYFSFSRKRCEILARECKKFNLVDSDEQEKILQKYDELVKMFKVENDPHALELVPFIKCGIAYHHAGMLPTLKEIVERLFTSRLIKLIFTTETFALGINMPSKTVVFDELRKFYGTNFDFLKTRDFYQMAGRAGRRGFDESGAVYSIVSSRRMSSRKLEDIIFGAPEPVLSQFNSNYATILSLYGELKERVTNIYPMSLHSFQSGNKQKKQGLFALKNKIAILKFMGYLDDSGLTTRGKFGSKIFGYELQATELFIKGFFEESSVTDICIMITAMIFDPRKNQMAPKLTNSVRNIKSIADQTSFDIIKAEKMFGIQPHTKMFFFHLSNAMEAWINGSTFEDLHNFTDVDEGEIIRNFRMVLQILREFERTEGCSEKYYEKIKNCVYLLKRDIIDPEKQFELG
ncbi:MAG: hypothetical protein ACD_79C00185G0002 [uncultured bacterium]|nr:MAG: hypothetical protein ACD_79C00185G0002 [uncultured bacterium]